MSTLGEPMLSCFALISLDHLYYVCAPPTFPCVFTSNFWYLPFFFRGPPWGYGSSLTYKLRDLERPGWLPLCGQPLANTCGVQAMKSQLPCLESGWTLKQPSLKTWPELTLLFDFFLFPILLPIFLPVSFGAHLFKITYSWILISRSVCVRGTQTKMEGMSRIHLPVKHCGPFQTKGRKSLRLF